MTRSEIADRLLEIRRYVRTRPDLVGPQIDETLRSMTERSVNAWHASRFKGSLEQGVLFVRVDPEVLENYLYNIAFELRCGHTEGRTR